MRKWRFHSSLRVLAFSLLLIFLDCPNIRAQKFAIKTNLAYDLLANVNLGAELGLSPRLTLDLSVDYNNWKVLSDRLWKHWMVQPEMRYWLCERFAGHFFGLHLQTGEFNARRIPFIPQENRYQGRFYGAGLGYGYSWMLGRHWNLEAEIGLGFNYLIYDVYPCAKCGDKISGDDRHTYIGPTKAALNLVYSF